MRFFGTILVVLALTTLSGCGPSGPTLMAVKGTVFYQGKPVPKASINIMCENGPSAIAQADDLGQFIAYTDGQPGVVVGKAKVMVAVTKMIGDPGPMDGTPEAAAKFSQMVNSGQIRYESAVPAKYAQLKTTTLEITVTDDPSKNDFKLELVD